MNKFKKLRKYRAIRAITDDLDEILKEIAKERENCSEQDLCDFGIFLAGMKYQQERQIEGIEEL